METLKLPDLSQLQNLLWIQTSFLGDIILQTAALHYVAEQHPHVRQYLITTPLGAKALAGHPALYRLLVFDKRGRSMLAAVKMVKRELLECQRDSTVLLQAHRSVRSSLLALALGFTTITYDESHFSFLADYRVPRVAVLHETQRLSLLLEPLGVKREQVFRSRPTLTPLVTAAMQTLGNSLSSNPVIGIAPGSVWGTKRWPVAHYIELAQMLLDKTKATLLILGSVDEKPAAVAMEVALERQSSRVINLAGKTSLDDLRDLYPRLNLLISNDSSPLHYASAFQVPTLAIFGATVPALGFGPLAAQSQIAQMNLDCRPCSDHGPQVCPLGHFKCMRDLLPERVADLALKLLDPETGKSTGT
jgi:heptosyltransferase-2